MFEVSEKVKVVNPDKTAKDELLNTQCVAAVKAAEFTGVVTQVQDGLNYVTFTSGDTNVTQVFKDDEIEGVS